MRYGICTSYDKLEIVKRSGADYIECTVLGLNELTGMQLTDFMHKQNETELRCEVLSVLFPSTIQLVGSEAGKEKIKEYLSRTFDHISVVQPEIIVFGSGGARKCPNGFCRDKALDQLLEVCHLLAELAKSYNIVMALEALNTSETNMVNSIMEANTIINTVNHPNFRLIADIYHMLVNEESATDLLACKDNLVHVHIASKEERGFPKEADRNMLSPFFEVLSDLKYNKRMSIESSADDFENQLSIALNLLRSFK